MSIKNKMHCIKVEIQSIEESKDRIRAHAAELNKLNHLSVGQELIVNDYKGKGKTLIAEKVFVSDLFGMDVELSAEEPVYFAAKGRIKNSVLPDSKGIHKAKITDLI